MTYIEQLHAPVARFPARKAKRTVVGTLVASVLVVTPFAAAGAASVGGAQAQISALRAQITSSAEQIHQLTESYTDASLQASSLRQQLGTQYAELRSLQRQLGHSETTLRRAALQSYTGAGTTGAATSVAATTNPAIGAEYLDVASGDVSNTIDVYQLRQRQVATTIGTISAEERASRQAVDAATSARQSALTEAAAEERQLGSLEAQLAAAQRAAAVSRATPAAQGLPVNNGVVDAARSQTSPATTVSSTPVAPATSPATSPTTTTPTTTGSGTSPTTTPPTTPPTTTPPTTTPPTGGGAGGVWLQLRTCESGDNYAENTGNGFYGAYQFSAETWTALGYPGRPDLEPSAMQDAAAMRLQAASGWGQWPQCAAELGLT